MIVAVAGEKGGCGKTSFAVHLSGWRVCAGRDVMLVDADRQGSASLWVESRLQQELPAPSTVRQFDRGSPTRYQGLIQTLRRHRGGHRLRGWRSDRSGNARLSMCRGSGSAERHGCLDHRPAG